MSPSEPEERAPRARLKLRTILSTRDRILCVAIVVAVLVPVVGVAAQFQPRTSGLPVAKDFLMWDTQTMRSLRLSDFRGKVVFLDIMATWCLVCKQQMPDLKEINDTYGGDSFVLLSVSGWWNDTVEKMQYYRARWWEELPPGTPQFSGNWTFGLPVNPSQVAYDYVVTGWPTTVVIDRDGLMTYRAVGRVPLATLVSHIESTLNA